MTTNFHDMSEDEFRKLSGAEQNKILAEMRKAMQSDEFGDRVSQLSLDQRRKIIADLKAELAALKAEGGGIQAQPAPAPVPAPVADDDTTLVNAADVAEMRKLWGTDEPEFITPAPLQPRFKAKSKKHSSARFLLLQLDVPGDLLWNRNFVFAEMERSGYLWSVTAQRWMRVEAVST